MLYFAGYSTDKELPQVTGVENLLESYLYFKGKDFVSWNRNVGAIGKNIFIDSGAFSAFTKGKKIDIDEYIKFIKENQSYITTYATLDVIGDYEATRKNTEYMEASGLHPLPTFHYGSPLSELERLCKKYDYIALGGLVPLSMQRKKLQAWLDKCFSVIMKQDKLIKVHGFGVNSFWAWKRYPFYSVDATSWLMGGKFRRVVEFKNGKFIAYNKRSTEINDKKLAVYNGHYTELNRGNVVEYLKAADYVTRLWANRGIIWK